MYLRQVLLPQGKPEVDELLNEDGEVYAHLLGEFDLVNVSIEFGHPFQAALERPEMQELQQQLRASGLWRRVAEACLWSRAV
ncbi:unnamed protein product [Durusdinium trenchii]|uniref:Uncharacterized protein n=1 Tax=Durusdinium trenchii TaxID=1381693 RepID=A0ABP0NHT9_9DINO